MGCWLVKDNHVIGPNQSTSLAWICLKDEGDISLCLNAHLKKPSMPISICVYKLVCFKFVSSLPATVISLMCTDYSVFFYYYYFQRFFACVNKNKHIFFLTFLNLSLCQFSIYLKACIFICKVHTTILTYVYPVAMLN